MSSRNARLLVVTSFITLFASGPAPRADGPKDNLPDNVRPVPPLPTTELSATDRAEIQAGAEKLGAEIESLRAAVADKPKLLARLPDVQIYFNAVRYPLVYHEQIDPKAARKALDDGAQRAAQLRAGQAPWLTANGPRGYVSRIDGSVQPYLLTLPPSYKPGDARKYPLELVSHGRNENLTELVFLNAKKDHAVGGDPDKLVVQLYGRYCNANKFAGEIDLLETLDDVKRQYPIDEDRLLNIGFSMGGAACWQFAVHYTDLFAANSPGAGFAETREFLGDFQKEAVKPTWYERKLWHLYDCTDYAANLFNGPTIAYAGEIDPQKQASDIMLEAMAAEGLTLDRIIGPNTKHAYEKQAKAELDRRLDEIIARGRSLVPPKVRFTTWTLRYNRMFWVTVDGLERHWSRARVDAETVGDAAVVAKTQNVSALTLSFPAAHSPFKPGANVAITIDDGAASQATAAADGSLVFHWTKSPERLDRDFPKRHGRQGPIDDAFMDSFVIVKPTGTPVNPKVGAWADAECRHAIDHWRRQFRGEARVKDDAAVTDADLAAANLILFGDPSSNKLIARIANQLPIRWDAKGVVLGDKTYPADHHVPVLVYPNPLNPNHYVVLNSGFTYREYDYLNNARQVPKLPDYAVIDVDSPTTSRAPGRVVDAGFFGEHWELLPNSGNVEQ